jgi:hypothetical protein
MRDSMATLPDTTRPGSTTVSDITQGADAPNDAALFQEAVDSSTTLEKFENPEPPKEPVKPADKPVEKSADKPADKDQLEAHVPAGRLREESEARRRAERERDELYARVNQQQPRQQQAPQRKDLFEDPGGFIREEVAPYLQQLADQAQRDREAFSADWAVRNYGEDKVTAGRQALERGLQTGDPNAGAVYQRAMQSHDPYGVITRWHLEREQLSAIGGDLESYKKRHRQELMNDPDFRREFMEAQRTQAATSGSSVARPAGQITQPKAPTVPSLSNIGAGGGDEQMQEPSDMQLFKTAVSAKRR